MLINVICIELYNNFCSIALKKNDHICYKEYINKTYTTKSFMYIFNSILMESNLFYKDLDVIIFNDSQNSTINIKAILLVIQSLSFIWKIPIIKTFSTLTLSFEFFLLTKKKKNFIIINDCKNILTCYSFLYLKNFKLIFTFKNLKKITNLNLKNDVIFLLNFNKKFKYTINFFDYNIFLKEYVFPKAFYTCVLSESLIILKNIIKLNKINSLFLNTELYFKHKNKMIN